MTLDEAALVWGRAVQPETDKGILSVAWWSWRREAAARKLIAALQLEPEKDEWGHFTSEYVSLACVMYAQDVAEGRHR